MDLLSVALELYALPPAEFTAARNLHARAAATAGDRSLAAEIRQLAKPSASAWALNQLAHDHPEIAGEFDELGTQLRSAQEHADRNQLDALMRQRKKLIRETSAAVRQAATAGDVNLSDSAVSEVEQSLQATLADANAAIATFSGRLVRSIQSDGLEPVDLDNAVAGPPLTSRPRATNGYPHPAAKAGRPAKAGDDAAKARTALIVRTRQAVEETDAALDAAQQAEKALDAERETLEADAVALQQQFDRLEQRRIALDQTTATRAQATRNARDASREAHRLADQATKAK